MLHSFLCTPLIDMHLSCSSLLLQSGLQGMFEYAQVFVFVQADLEDKSSVVE